MDIAQITAVIGAAASLLCTLVVGALTYFMKRTLASLEKADEKNAADIRAETDRREQAVKDLTGQLNDLQKDMPYVFVLREDFIRITKNLEDKIGDMDRKMDQVLEHITSAIADRKER